MSQRHTDCSVVAFVCLFVCLLMMTRWILLMINRFILMNGNPREFTTTSMLCRRSLHAFIRQNCYFLNYLPIFATTLPKNRIRENLSNTLTRKFIDEMKLYQSAQQKYKTDIKNKVTRQVQIVKPDATDEEINMVMKSEGGREALYQQAVLSGGVSDSIK